MTYKRIGAILIALILLLSVLPVGTPQAALPSIEEQIRAYAKSINQSGADDDAAWALAMHGITGGGETLKMGADHSLTATLFNSNAGLATLVRGCEQAVQYMHQHKLSCIFVDGGCCWYSDATYYTDTLYDPITGECLKRPDYIYLTDPLNNYDQSLLWMAGTTQIHQTITRKDVTADTITYDVAVSIVDRFDFDHSTSAPAKIMSILGSILFRGFDWETTVTFSLIVPNTCTHCSGNEDCFEDSAKAPTCTTDGYIVHTCKLCGYERREKTAAKFGHDWGAWYTAQVPTCSATGEEKRTCARCKNSETRVIAKTTHNLISHEGQAPTCTTEGWQAYESCSDCTYTTYAAIPTAPHSYEAVVTPSTCIAQGYTTHTCTACGHSYTDAYINSGQHSYKFTVTPPTCGAAGEMISLCTHCGDRIVTPYDSATGRHTYDNDHDPDCNKCGTIREVTSPLPGDVNGDGKVNNRDLGLLQRHLNGWASIVGANADLNNDGRVNNRDLGLLQQQLNE